MTERASEDDDGKPIAIFGLFAAAVSGCIVGLLIGWTLHGAVNSRALTVFACPSTVTACSADTCFTTCSDKSHE
jgi:hypothetical protein